MRRFISAKRVLRVALHVACALAYLRPGLENDNRFRKRWSRQLLRMLGIELEMQEIHVPHGSVLVANHVSWLDVIVLSALLPPDCPVDFVAKAEIRRWPLIGWLLARHDCLFVERRIGRHLLQLNAEIGDRLASGRVVAFFPEGTTTDGSELLPFRPALFEPAVRGEHRLQAFALGYRDFSGRRSEAAAFVGQQNLWASLLAIAALPELVAGVAAGSPVATAGLTRREAASRAQAAVRGGLYCARSSSGTRSRMNSLSSCRFGLRAEE